MFMKSEECLDLTKNTTMKLDVLTKQDIASDGKPLVNSIIFFAFLFLVLLFFIIMQNRLAVSN